jgi:penicillin amidase
MRLAFRVLLALLAAGAAVVVFAGAFAYYFAARSLPDYDRAWSVDGLGGPVEIVRDAAAVAHVFAASDADAFFGLGWAHAEDRLWQMELQRLTAQGRLAEMFGPEAAPIDLAMRALDLDRLGRRAADALPAEIRALLDAYAAGVNARIRGMSETAAGRAAPEFFLFGVTRIAPWTAADSAAIVKLMALRLTTAAQIEARRARLMAHLTPEQIEDVEPSYPDAGFIALPTAPKPETEPGPAPEPAPGAPRARAALPPGLSPFAEPGFGGASNAWAVSGDRSATGAPLLAADPHLWLSAPVVWHLARLTSPGLDAIGATIPGVPAVLIGRNRALGWGLTTAQIDDQDIFLEQIDPTDPGRYRTPDGWREFEVREETIRVAGAEPVRARLRWTRHGPVPPEGADLDFRAVTPAGHVAALAWTALDPDDRSLEAAIRLMQAGSIEEAEAAAALHLAPAQNLVLADATGVAMVLAGRAPRRDPANRSQGRVPSLGWLPENDWLGALAPEDKPRALRPRSGAVANANNRTTNAPFPAHLSFDWADPYRIRRLERRLNDRAFHSLDSFKELQSDAVSEMARSVLPLIARELWWGEAAPAESPADRRRAAALALLRDWNGEMSAHDPEPLIFSAWLRALTRRLAEDELGALFPEVAGFRPLFVERVFHDIGGAARWCDVVKTPEPETCGEIARRALDDALAELAGTRGDDPAGWRWGEAHRAVFTHSPLGFFPMIAGLVNIEHETPGDGHTIHVGGMTGRGALPYANVHAPGFRMVLDFADLDRSEFVSATGQSGHPLSRRYDDLSPLFRRGEYLPMSLNPADARAGAAGVTRLSPR